MELNKEACEAATGAVIERLTNRPATSDLLAALRFALEAYESVRVAPAPASQQEASGAAIKPWEERIEEWRAQNSIGVVPEKRMMRAEIAELRTALTSRAQRTNTPNEESRAAIAEAEALIQRRRAESK